MQAQRQEYPPYTTLKSSSDLGWSALVAELRSYPPSEGSGPAAPQARIGIVLGGSEGIATYKIGGHWRSARTTPGLMWLKPTGGKHDEARIASKDSTPGQRKDPEIVFSHLMEGIGLALDLKGGRMFVTDFAGSVYSA